MATGVDRTGQRAIRARTRRRLRLPHRAARRHNRRHPHGSCGRRCLWTLTFNKRPMLPAAWVLSRRSINDMSSSSELRVMSFNIRNTQAPDGPNHWIHRRELWAASVRAFAPDLLGLQEVWSDQHEQLREMFPDYGFAGVARDDGRDAGERASVLYRLERFQLLDSGNFWLSESPTVVGSKSWDSKHVRICSWVRVRDRQSNEILLHANTHLD